MAELLSDADQRECRDSALAWVDGLRPGAYFRGVVTEARLRYTFPLSQALFAGCAIMALERISLQVDTRGLIVSLSNHGEDHARQP